MNSKIKNVTKGRIGTIHYYLDNKEVKLFWELGFLDKEACILILPLDLKEWSEPKGEKIPRDKQYEIAKDINRLLEIEGIRSDISLKLSNEKIEFDDIPCVWKNCEKQRVKGVAYCIEHGYFNGLLKDGE